MSNHELVGVVIFAYIIKLVSGAVTARGGVIVRQISICLCPFFLEVFKDGDLDIVLNEQFWTHLKSN